jgi:broad specificity phosphatase PhoE
MPNPTEMQTEPVVPLSTLSAEPLPILLPESFTIYLVRHATPDRTRPDISYHTPPGPSLNDRGLMEAEELGAFLRQAGVLFILSSPFERARQTALIAAKQAGVSLDFDPDLGERQPIEPETTVIERVVRAFQTSVQAAAQNGPLALLSHGSPILVLLKALGLPVPTLERCRIYDNRNLIAMAGAWRVERLDGSLSMRPVFAPQGVALPNFPETIAEKENP